MQRWAMGINRQNRSNSANKNCEIVGIARGRKAMRLGMETMHSFSWSGSKSFDRWERDKIFLMWTRRREGI